MRPFQLNGLSFVSPAVATESAFTAWPAFWSGADIEAVMPAFALKMTEALTGFCPAKASTVSIRKERINFFIIKMFDWTCGLNFFRWILVIAGNLYAANVSAAYDGKQVFIGWIYKSVQEYTVGYCFLPVYIIGVLSEIPQWLWNTWN